MGAISALPVPCPIGSVDFLAGDPMLLDTVRKQRMLGQAAGVERGHNRLVDDFGCLACAELSMHALNGVEIIVFFVSGRELMSRARWRVRLRRGEGARWVPGWESSSQSASKICDVTGPNSSASNSSSLMGGPGLWVGGTSGSPTTKSRGRAMPACARSMCADPVHRTGRRPPAAADVRARRRRTSVVAHPVSDVVTFMPMNWPVKSCARRMLPKDADDRRHGTRGEGDDADYGTAEEVEPSVSRGPTAVGWSSPCPRPAWGFRFVWAMMPTFFTPLLNLLQAVW